MVEGGMKCIKYLLFAFNLIFFLAGLSLIIAGAVVQTKFKTFFDFFGNEFSSAAILLIVVGCIIFLIGFFGCCGAIKENYCMVMTFAILLVVIFIVEIGAGVAAFILKANVKSGLKDGMTKALDNYPKTGSEGVRTAWDHTQRMFHCCGVNSYTDWKNILTTKVPDSCCIAEKAGCGSGVNWNDPAVANKTINTAGCLQGMEDWVVNNVYVVAGVGIGLAFIQIVGVIFACCLARSIKKEYEVV